jgi:hypothetical protein
LSGAAEALREAIGLTLPSVESRIYERTVATIKAKLGEDAFGTAFVAGQKMTLDEAVLLGQAK